MLFATLIDPFNFKREGTNVEFREVSSRNSKIPKVQLPVPTYNLLAPCQ
jgi:hypothetical protein